MEPEVNQPQRCGVVAVVVREQKFLVIRRSAQVVAPRAFCFPGGAIEPGESEELALVREMREELAVEARLLRPLWQSITPWGVALSWWLVELPNVASLVPQPAEVESVHWLTADEMLALPELLESNRHFFAAIASGEIVIDL